MRPIPTEQITRRLREENPWWAETAEIQGPFRSLSPRAYLDFFLPLVQDHETRRAVVLMGPRRVGKTVLIHHVIARLLADGTQPTQVCYVSVDHPLYNGLSLESFFELYREAVGFQEGEAGGWVFFDEVQYLKDWEIHLKALVDRWPSIKWVVSGSAAAALKLKSTESGAGRFTDFLLPPLTFYEFLQLKGCLDLVDFDGERKKLPGAPDIDALNDEFLEYLNHGGYPEAVFSKRVREDPQRHIKNDIIDKVLLRDLPSLYGIQDIQELNYLFTTLAFNTADEVSPEKLSKNSGVTKNTIKKYIEYLEAAFLVRIVYGFDRTAKRFKRDRQFKVYLTNPSMRSALFAPIGADDEAIGGLVETAIFAQWFHRPESPFYARWKDGEVDLVKLRGNHSIEWVLEAKWSDHYWDQPGKLKSLLNFCQDNKQQRAWVTSRTTQGVRNVHGVELMFLPASLYCFAVGYWGIRERSSEWLEDASAEMIDQSVSPHSFG